MVLWEMFLLITNSRKPAEEGLMVSLVICFTLVYQHPELRVPRLLPWEQAAK